MSVLSIRRVLRHSVWAISLVLPPCLSVIDVAWAQPAAPPRAAAAAPGVTRLGPAAPAAAQPAVEGAPKPAAAEPGKPLPFLTMPDGTKIPIPAGLWEEFQRWLASQQARAYHVTGLTLEGTVSGDRAVLDARVEIRVNRADEWVPVSLRMRTGNTVLLSAPRHSGPGESRPDTTAADPATGERRQPGLRRWLRGKGLHVLTYRLSVPVVRDHPGRRLTLALPTPAAAGARLVLKVPGGPLRASTADGRGHVATKPGQNGTTRIEVFGLGDRVDLSWRSAAAAEPDDITLVAELAVAVGLNTDSVVLKAIQRIRILKGQPGTITVNLPAGFQLVDVRGDAIGEPQVDPDEPGRVHLPLTDQDAGTGSDPLEIRWTLQGDFPDKGQPLVVEGFAVERSRFQTGHVAVSRLDNYLNTFKQGSFVHRIDVDKLPRRPELVPLFGEDVASAWEILKQPFRLELNLLEIEPQFVAEPHLFLELSEDEAVLTVEVPQARVFRGAVETLEFPWPGWTEQGWAVLADESPELQFRYDDEQQVLQVSLAGGARTKDDGPFAVRFRAARPVAGTDAFPLALPGIATPTPANPILVVGNAIDVESEFTSFDEAAARPLSARRKAGLALPEGFGELTIPIDNYFRLAPDARGFQARVMPQDRQVTTSSSIAALYSDRRLKVTQRIDYQVAYARLGFVRLMVPRPLQETQVRFQLEADGQGEPILLVAREGIEVGSQKQFEIQLDEDRIGKFRLLVEFELPVPEVLAIASVQVRVPLVQSSDAPYASTRFELIQSGAVQADPDGETWQRELDVANRPVWRATGSPPEVALTLKRTDDSAGHNFTVPRVAVVSVIENRESGNVQSRAWFQIRGDVTTLSVRFPPGRATLAGPRPPLFSWDNQVLAPDQFREVQEPNGARVFRLDVSRFAAEAEHLLKVDYQLHNAWEHGWVSSRHQLVAPQLAETVHVAETLWQVRLPVGQHLLSGSSSHTPQFRWNWQSFHFRRASLPGYDRIDNWLGRPAAQLGLPTAAAGNSYTYTYTCFGPPRSLAFASMSQWTLVLLGAGLALAAGLVLLYIPTSRHVLSFLVLAFVVALAAVWNAEPVVLLLQPASLGFALALAAALIHRRFGRQPSINMLPLTGPTGPLPVSTAQHQLAPAVAGVEPATVIHTPPGSSVGSAAVPGPAGPGAE